MTLLATRITDRLAALLGTCQGGSYLSSVGSEVFVGQVAGAERQAPCAFLIPERLNTEQKYAQELVSRDYRIAAFVKLSDHPNSFEHAVIDQIIADVRRVLETHDAGLASLGAEVALQAATPGYHESGGLIVGAALTYRVRYPQAVPA